MATLQFKISNQTVPPPVEWPSTVLEASFEDSSPQASVKETDFTFVAEAAQLLKDHIAGGLSGTTPGIFEGPAFQITAFNPGATITPFIGYVDLADDMIEDPRGVKIKAKVKRSEGIKTLEEAARGLMYGYLESVGAISNADYIDMPYLVEPETDFIELALLGITIYLMVQQLADAARAIAKDIAGIAGESAGGITGALGGVILAVANLAIIVIYAGVLIIYLKDLAEELIQNLISPIRYFKVVTLRTLLEKAAAHLGYTIASSIPELDTIHYQSSQIEDGSVLQGFPGSGIPKSGDYGYTFYEMLDLCQNRLLHARSVVTANGTLRMEPLNSPFWLNQSSYQIPGTLQAAETKAYNTKQLKTNFGLRFAHDDTNFYTVNDATDRSYEVITVPITQINPKNNGSKGAEFIETGCSLPTRKDQLSNVEIIVKAVASTIDGVINFFFGSSNYAQRVDDRVGMLKISSRTTSKPMLIPFNGIEIPIAHRQIWSARFLWDNYHNWRSFVDNNFGGQYIPYKGIKVPFSLDDFVSLIDFGYCTDADGNPAEIVNIAYQIDKDFAILDYRVKQVYTKNLREIKIAQI